MFKHDANKSAIVQHFDDCENVCQKGPPNVKWNDSKICARVQNPGIRRARESLEIKLHKKDSINRNSGQPELDTIWNKAIKKHHKT